MFGTRTTTQPKTAVRSRSRLSPFLPMQVVSTCLFLWFGVKCWLPTGFISSNIFFASEKPKYPTALGVTAGFEGLGLIVVLGVRTWMILDNKRRNRAQGVNWQSKDVPTEALAEGPESASFRHFY
jgi:hypothetical protein